MMNKSSFKKVLFLLFVSISLFGQKKELKINVLQDEFRGTDTFLDILENELKVLLDNEYMVSLNTIRADFGNVNQKIKEAYQGDPAAVIVLGIMNNLAIKEKQSFEIPTLAAITMERSDRPTTGIPNFSFIQSPFDMADDLRVFRKVTDYNNVAILMNSFQQQFISEYQKKFELTDDIQILETTADLEKDVAAIPAEIDAVYIFPFTYDNPQKDSLFYDALNAAGYPTFALMGRPEVERGILAGRANSEFWDIYARKLAIDVMKIAEGEDPKDFDTRVIGVEDEFVINVETMKKIGIYPDFDVMAEALLLNVDKQPNARQLSLKGAILEAMERNLDLDIAKASVASQRQQIKIAKSNALPQVDFSTNLTYIDPDVSENQLTVDELAWAGSFSFSQLIYAEPVYANIAIQKLLEKASIKDMEQTQLEVYQNTAATFLNYLRAQTNVKIQQFNVEVTTKNLSFAKTRASIGQSSQADIYRLDAQLANNHIALNDALTQRQQLKFQLNVLLNRPKNEDIQATDITLSPEYIVLADPKLDEYINSQYQVQVLGDFLVEYAMIQAPSLQQLDFNIEASERNVLANKRSLYVPQVGVGGGWSQTWGRFLDGSADIEQMRQALGPLFLDPTTDQWQVQAVATIPIFQGFNRKASIQQSQIQLEQLKVQKQNAEQFIEANIRSSLENLANSYGDVQLTNQSAEAANEYLKIVQDLYREGAANLTNLLEAQTSAISAELAAAAAKYQLVIDGVNLEIASGFPAMLSTDAAKNQFIEQYIQYLISNNN